MRYRLRIKAARYVEVEAGSEKEAFDLAFEESEWDYDMEVVDDIEGTG